MQDKSIDGALLALRKQIIRGKLDGLGHVEALLVMRGVDMPRVMPAKRPDASRRGHMKLLVMEALRDGPRRLRDIAAHVASKRPELSQQQAYQRADQALQRMRTAGLVVNGRGVWWLDPQDQP